jgi:hypothetical protein
MDHGRHACWMLSGMPRLIDSLTCQQEVYYEHDRMESIP